MVVVPEVNDQEEGRRYAGTLLRGLTAPIPDTRQRVTLIEQINNDSGSTDRIPTDRIPTSDKRTRLVVLRQDDGGRLMKTCGRLIASDSANEEKMTPAGYQSYETST